MPWAPENNATGRTTGGTQLAAREPTGHQEIRRLLCSHNAARLADAALRREISVVRELLQASADPNHPDDIGRLPLHAAACSGGIDVVRELLTARADPNCPENQESNSEGLLPLQIAAWQGHTDVTNLLLQWSANPNAPDGRGWTPLVSASGQGHAGTAQALIDRRADPGRAAVVVNRRQPLTPLQAAQEGRHARVGEVLKTALARPKASGGTSRGALMQTLGRVCPTVCSCCAGSETRT